MSRASLGDWLAPLPLVAILRGVRPDEAVGIGRALLDAGFRIIEVPLNSPEPFVSIGRLVEAFGERTLIGAGTVLAAGDVARLAVAGGRLVVMPHADPAVIGEAKRLGLLCLPGVATPTEAFAALAAGADGLKLFPGELIGPPVLKALGAVLPPATRLFPVGGITPGTMAAYVAAGADGFGLGSALYRPGMTPADVARTAAVFAGAWSELAAGQGRSRLYCGCWSPWSPEPRLRSSLAGPPAGEAGLAAAAGAAALDDGAAPGWAACGAPWGASRTNSCTSVA